MFKPFVERNSGGVAGSQRGPSRHADGRLELVDTTVSTQPISSPTQPVIGVLGAKGGVGATTLAINLSTVIARDFAATTLIDANLQQPDVAVVLGKQADYGVLELLERAHEVTTDIVHACSVPVSSYVPNCRLVTAPVDGQAAITTHLTALANCLTNMRACSPVWVIDLPKHLDRHLVTLMDRCDVVVLVFEPTISSIVAAKRWLKVFDDLGYPRTKICCVLNRAGGKIRLVEEQMEQLAAFESLHRVPNAYELAERSATRGEPLTAAHPRSPLAMALRDLTRVILARFSNVKA